MLNKNLVSLLKSFDKKEFSEFEKFAASPYFSRDRNVMPVLKYIKKFHPHYPPEKLDLQLIHKKAYPGKKYSEPAIRMQLSVILSLCKEFLSVSFFLKKKFESKFYLIEQLQNRDIPVLFNSESAEIEKLISSELNITSENINAIVELNGYKISQAEFEGKHTLVPDLYYSNGEQLPVGYLIKLINNVQDIITGRNNYIMKKKKVFSEILLENTDFDKLIDFIVDRKPVGYQMILFYYNRLKFYTTNGDYNYFKKAKEFLFSSWNRFAHFEVYSMMINLSNCCWWQIKLGKNMYKDELFEIYELWLKSGYINFPGYPYMDILVFKNIFWLGINNNNISWSEKFLNENSNRLSPLYANDAVSYSYAVLHYYRKEFAEAIDLLKITDYRNYVYKMECQVLMLKIFYETNAVENLFSLADSYLHFLNKHKNENVLVGKRNLNFTRLLIKLQKIKLKFDTAAINTLKETVTGNNLVTSKQWLLDEINKLIITGSS